MRKKLFFLNAFFSILMLASLDKAYAQDSSVNPNSERANTNLRQILSSDKQKITDQWGAIKENASQARQEEKNLLDQIHQAVQSGDYQTAKNLKEQLKNTHQENIQEKLGDREDLKESLQNLKEDRKEGINQLRENFQDKREGLKDRREDIRDKREDFKDRREDIRDKREDFKDRREDIRDKREDIRDMRHDGGKLDRIEDRRDRKEDIRDRQENRVDRREDRRDHMKNQAEGRNEKSGVRDHKTGIGADRARAEEHKNHPAAGLNSGRTEHSAGQGYHTAGGHHQGTGTSHRK